MKRDGALESLWQYGLEDYTAASAKPGEDGFDVLIAGGGMTGIVTGLLLQKAGKKCIIAEANSIGFGTTGGTSAHLNSFFDTPYQQVKKDFGEDSARLLAEAAEEGIKLIKENTAQYSIDCDLEEKPAYIFSLSEQQDKVLEELVTGAKLVQQPIDFINDSPFPIPYRKLAIIADQAQFHPTKYIFALAKEFENAGGVILTGA